MLTDVFSFPKPFASLRSGDTWVTFWTPCSHPWMNLHTSMPISCCSVFYTSLMYFNDWTDKSSFSALFQNCLGCFHTLTLFCDIGIYPFNRQAQVTKAFKLHGPFPRRPGVQGNVGMGLKQVYWEKGVVFIPARTHPSLWVTERHICLLKALNAFKNTSVYHIHCSPEHHLRTLSLSQNSSVKFLFKLLL